MAGKVAIIVRLQFPGVHCWPGAPVNLPEAYLRFSHRHVFHVEAVKPVSHEDRDIEIIAFKRTLQEYCYHYFGEGRGTHTLSCEMMARQLLETFGLSRCQVTEDGENGAEVTCSEV